MMAELGMSDVLGPVAFQTATRSRFLGAAEQPTAPAAAEETAREIDLEVKRLMTDAHIGASQILRQHRATLDTVIRLLLEREVVDGEEVRRLLAAGAASSLRLASA
jgi:cell division protease FtsH